MTRLIRWEPYRAALSIRERMDRFFNEPLSALRGWPDGASIPVVDLYQTDDEIVVKAVLQGIKPDDINISVTGDVLTLRGSAAKIRSGRTRPTTCTSDASANSPGLSLCRLPPSPSRPGRNSIMAC